MSFAPATKTAPRKSMPCSAVEWKRGRPRVDSTERPSKRLRGSATPKTTLFSTARMDRAALPVQGAGDPLHVSSSRTVPLAAAVSRHRAKHPAQLARETRIAPSCSAASVRVKTAIVSSSATIPMPMGSRASKPSVLAPRPIVARSAERVGKGKQHNVHYRDKGPQPVHGRDAGVRGGNKDKSSIPSCEAASRR
jgi:hypothetical protein